MGREEKNKNERGGEKMWALILYYGPQVKEKAKHKFLYLIGFLLKAQMVLGSRFNACMS